MRLDLSAIGLVTGEVGSGKSTALRYALSKLHPSEYHTIYITAVSGSILEFYRQFTDALDIRLSSNSKAVMTKVIKEEIADRVCDKKIKPVLDMSGLRQPKYFNYQERLMEKHTKIRTAFILLKKLLEVQQLIANFEGEIDFSNPRIICFAQEFSIDDKCLALSLNAELWKYRYYENQIMTIIREEEPEQLIRNKLTGKTSIVKIVKEPKKAKCIDEHLSGVSKELKALFSEINERILQISDEIERYTTNAEIIYKTSLNFAYIAMQKRNNALRILSRSATGHIKDPSHLTEVIPKTHGYGKITHQMHIIPKKDHDEKHLNDIMDIIFQAYTATQ